MANFTANEIIVFKTDPLAQALKIASERRLPEGYPEEMRAFLDYFYPVPDGIKDDEHERTAWKRDHWGIYCDAWDIVLKEKGEMLICSFITKTGCPYGVLKRISGDYPDTLFTGSWADEGYFSCGFYNKIGDDLVFTEYEEGDDGVHEFTDSLWRRVHGFSPFGDADQEEE